MDAESISWGYRKLHRKILFQNKKEIRIKHDNIKLSNKNIDYGVIILSLQTSYFYNSKFFCILVVINLWYLCWFLNEYVMFTLLNINMLYLHFNKKK